MAEDIVTHLKAEEARILAALYASPGYRRLQAIQNAIRAYGADPQRIDATTSPLAQVLAGASSPLEKGSPEVSRPSREGTKASEIVREAERFLELKGSRAQSNEILEHLENIGIKVAGSNPVAVVASYLSTSKQFDNVRGQGYGLAKWRLPSVNALDESLRGVESPAAAPVTEAAAK